MRNSACLLAAQIVLAVQLCAALPTDKAASQLVDEGDYVHRPLHWNGLERPNAPKKLDQLSTRADGLVAATHQHGVVQPFVAAASERFSGYDTYRVYLLFDDAIGQSMYAFYGDEYSALSLHTDDNSPFFNVEDPFGTNTGGVHPAMFEVKPESQFDSWLTLNQDDGANKEKIKCAVLSLVEFRAAICTLRSSVLATIMCRSSTILFE